MAAGFHQTSLVLLPIPALSGADLRGDAVFPPLRRASSITSGNARISAGGSVFQRKTSVLGAPLMNSCAPRNGRMNFPASGVFLEQSSFLSELVSKRCPPSLGILPKTISGTPERRGAERDNHHHVAAFDKIRADVSGGSNMQPARCRRHSHK